MVNPLLLTGNFRIQVFTPEVVNTQQLSPAQEICNNRVDDDGNGLVGIEDLDCQKDFLSRLPSMMSPFNLQ